MQANNKNILYISYDGMTDPLGQSQVIPYLAGLAKKGFNITLVSAEKEENYQKSKAHIAQLLAKHQIEWRPVNYTKNPPILSTVKDINTIKKEVKKIVSEKNIHLSHCRSYISAFVGVWLKHKYNIPFLFDMRGFWANERVDGNIWNLNNPLFKQVYNFFKHKEKTFLQEADAVVSLTEAAKIEMSHWDLNTNLNKKTSVIPCCADFKHFDYHTINNEQLDHWKTKLDIPDNAFVLSYLGSIGTWYMLDEMLDFYKVLKTKETKAIFLFITRDNKELVMQTAIKSGLNPEDIRITPATREEVPLIAKLSSASLFFIKPAYSKIASSPTKMAELMGLGVPIVANNKVGDVEEIMLKNPSGVLIDNFTNEVYSAAVDKLLKINTDKQEATRKLAMENFSLDQGIATFENIYTELT